MVRRLIVIGYIVLFASVAVASTTFFLSTRAEYLQLKEAQRLSAERLAMAQVKLREQEEVLRRLRDDPSFVETIIRRRLGYAKPDEFIFRFESPAGFTPERR